MVLVFDQDFTVGTVEESRRDCDDVTGGREWDPKTTKLPRENTVGYSIPLVYPRRMLGNRKRLIAVLTLQRSIPARAGEPQFKFRTTAACRVYPRACGGTLIAWTTHPPAGGLSPRVRGNPGGAFMGRDQYGSIPARAGEPRVPGGPATHRRVYPRACGEPPMEEEDATEEEVYPRACGGTRRPQRHHQPRQRSIPARAGEPPVLLPDVLVNWVYPRACGGTLEGHALPQ